MKNLFIIGLMTIISLSSCSKEMTVCDIAKEKRNKFLEIEPIYNANLVKIDTLNNGIYTYNAYRQMELLDSIAKIQQENQKYVDIKNDYYDYIIENKSQLQDCLL